jgi:hypothetical protein
VTNPVVQVFGIGTDSAVWTAYDGSKGWHTMGGVAVAGAVAWADIFNNAVVQVEGTDGNLHCRYRTGNTGKWGAWFKCSTWAANGSSFCVAGCPIPTTAQAKLGRAARQKLAAP